MRLFVSISLSDEMKNFIRRYALALKHTACRGRYPSEDNYHITLAFIGEYDNSTKVKAALESVRFEPFDVTAGGLGSFGNTYFVNVTSEAGSLDALSERVKVSLDVAGIPFDRKRFKGHITIGRDIDAELSELSLCTEKHKMHVSKISLMRSDLIAGRRVYRELFSVIGK